MLRLRVLGPPVLTDEGGRPLDSILRQPRQMGLIIYLLLSRGGPLHRRDSVLVHFWPEADEQHARNSLSRSLKRLREDGLGTLLVKRGTQEIGIDRSLLWCDAVALEQALANGDPAAAIDLYRGPFLEGFVIPKAPEWEDWAHAQRLRLRGLAEDALHALLVPAAEGDPRAAADLALRLAAEDPWDSRMAAATIGLLGRAGEVPRALRFARAFQERRALELEEDPDPTIEALSASLRSALVRSAPGAGPHDRLIGRAGELDDIHRLLEQDDVRMLTLSGAGGVGKTRLALEAAWRYATHDAREVVTVELASTQEVALVVPAIAGALGIHATGSVSLADAVRARLASRPTLLLLDNMEHLPGAGSVVASLLDRVPRLKVLATSRAPLRVRGEHELPVLPLPVPEAVWTGKISDLEKFSSAELFVERAHRVQPAFQLTEDNAADVATICRRLDGLPLAIELAAAGVRRLPLPLLRQRLEDGCLDLLIGGGGDLPPRQRTIRNTIRWSVELLSPPERAFFRSLSVFAGGCTMEGAEAICAGPETLARDDVLEALQSLVEAGLLHTVQQPHHARFRFLETIREFGQEALSAHNEEDRNRRRHAQHFVEYAERAAEYLLHVDQLRWLDALETEHANLRAALRWARENGEVQYAVRLADALWLFWILHCHFDEGERQLAEVLAMVPPSAVLERARLSVGAGAIAFWRGDYAQAVALCGGGLPLCRTAGAKWHAAVALSILVALRLPQDDLGDAPELARECLELAMEIDSPWVASIAHGLIGFLRLRMGDVGAALRHNEEGLALARRVGENWAINQALSGLGFVLLAAGEIMPARACFLEGLELCRELGYQLGISLNLDDLASAALGAGDLPHAARLLGAAAGLRSALNAEVPLANTANWEATCQEVRAGLGPHAFESAWNAGFALSPDQALALARGSLR